MRDGPRGGIVCLVAPDFARLSIVFDLSAEPIAGVVCDAGGQGLPFAGWMELTRAIERGLEAARRDDAADTSDVSGASGASGAAGRC